MEDISLRYYYLDPTGTYTEEQISQNVLNNSAQCLLIDDLYDLKKNNPQIEFDTQFAWNTKSNEELQTLLTNLKASI
jgi:hypothetical protein